MKILFCDFQIALGFFRGEQNLKKGGKKMFKLNSLWAENSRSELTHDTIQLVRKDRGLNARGDALLMSAQMALKFNDMRTVHLDLIKFLSIVENLTAEHRAIIEVECGQVLSAQYIKLKSMLKIMFRLFYEILLHLLAFKHPPICIQTGMSFRLNKCQVILKASTLKIYPLFWGFLVINYYNSLISPQDFIMKLR